MDSFKKCIKAKRENIIKEQMFKKVTERME